MKKDGNVPASDFSVSYYDNAWRIAEVCGYLPPDKCYLSSDVNQLSNLFKENNITDAKELYHFRIQSFSSDFLYIKTDNEEYFIPLTFYDKNSIGLEDKNVYTKDEFMKIFKPTVKTLIENDEKGLASGGPIGLPHNNSNNSGTKNIHSSINYTGLIIVILICLFIAGTGFVIYRKRKIRN